MKTRVLSRNGYKIKKNELDLNILKEIKNELTVNPFTYGDFGDKTEKKFSLYMESPNSLYLPRFYAQDKLGIPTENKINKGEPISIKFNGSLRKEQEPIVKLYQEASKNGGGLISLKCGGGKTVLALYIVSLLKVKTIVVVHKDFLMTQWRDRIQQFLPEARIGKIQQNTVDIENKDIVLAMVQSLSMKEYDEGTFDSFGLAIFDECHHLGAEKFSKCIQLCHAVVRPHDIPAFLAASNAIPTSPQCFKLILGFNPAFFIRSLLIHNTGVEAL